MAGMREIVDAIVRLSAALESAGVDPAGLEMSLPPDSWKRVSLRVAAELADLSKPVPPHSVSSERMTVAGVPILVRFSA